MTEQRTGKATAELFEQVILRQLGATDADESTLYGMPVMGQVWGRPS